MLLQTDRLYFREFTTGDAPLLYQLNSDPDVLKYVHEEPLKTLEQAHEKLVTGILPQYREYGYGRWAVFLKNQDIFIGWCGLKYRAERQETDLGYRFMKKYWGQGYATEAARASLAYGCNQLKIKCITAMAHVENLASLRIIENIGFRFAGEETVETCPVKTYLFRP
jgi:RimJ/RimL family protein N-acetyltransferase